MGIEVTLLQDLRRPLTGTGRGTGTSQSAIKGGTDTYVKKAETIHPGREITL